MKARGLELFDAAISAMVCKTKVFPTPRNALSCPRWPARRMAQPSRSRIGSRAGN